MGGHRLVARGGERRGHGGKAGGEGGKRYDDPRRQVVACTPAKREDVGGVSSAEVVVTRGRGLLGDGGPVDGEEDGRAERGGRVVLGEDGKDRVDAVGHARAA